MTDRIPVTLLTGFLGSGKSTLLSNLLRDPRFSDTAVVVNEFGEVGLDGFLVEHAPDQVVEMTSGCLCCTVRGDVRDTLLRLHARAASGEIGLFSRLVIETTGLADPAPVIQTLIQDPRLVRRFTLAGVVTLVDAVTGEATLDRQPEAIKQAAVADRIVVTKSDLARDSASQRDVAALLARLAALNPAAAPLDRHDPSFDLRRLFDTAAFDPLAKSLDVRAWLNAEAFAPGESHGHTNDHGNGDRHDHGHDHHHHQDHDAHLHGHGHDHDVNRHGADIRAFVIRIEAPVPTAAFTEALESLIVAHGPQLLRVKGVLCLAEKPAHPVVIHGVQHVFHDPMILKHWPDEDRASRLVFITRGIEPDGIEAVLRRAAAPVPEQCPDT